MKVIWKMTLSPTQKLVLLALADYGSSIYPSIPTICEKTSLGRTAVVRALGVLKSEGLLARTHRGKRQSNLYQIDVDQCGRRTGTGNEPVREATCTSPRDGLP
jgi:hypothetical protein